MQELRLLIKKGIDPNKNVERTRSDEDELNTKDNKKPYTTNQPFGKQSYSLPQSVSRKLVVLGLFILSCYVIYLMTRQLNPEVIETPKQYYEFQDLSTISGRYKEAYGFLLCTRSDADAVEQTNFDALRVIIHRLLNIMKKQEEAGDIQYQKDIIAVICHHTPFWQYVALQNIGIVVIPVPTINPPMSVNYKRWQDNFTKFQFWRLINWNRILVMDIDIFFYDDFTTIWDEPATQIKHAPEEHWKNREYFGFKAEKLYPYVHAAAIDSSSWKKWTELDKFNAGFYVMKPNLVHFHLLMQIAHNNSLHFEEMEQSVLNFVYSRRNEGPIPFIQLNETYNFYPDPNPKRNISTKAFHIKVWKENPPAIYNDMIQLWNVYLVNMKKDFLSIVVYDEGVEAHATNHSISITNLRVSEGQATFFAIASTNLTHVPTHKEIIDRIGRNGTYTPGSSSTSVNGQTNISIIGLEPKTKYNIYYFANTTIRYSELTDVYYTQILTKGDRD